MYLTHLMEKAEQIQYELVCYLHSQPGPVSLKDAAEVLNCSKTTLIKYYETLNETMLSEGLACQIIQDQQNLSLVLGADLYWEELVSVLLQNSVKYQVLQVLYRNYRFNITQLAMELMISEATLNRHLASLNNLLKEFQLCISHGQLVGSELQKRFFFTQLYSHTWSKDKRSRFIKVQKYDRIIFLIERLCNIPLTKNQSNRLALFLTVSHDHYNKRHKDFSGINKLMIPFEENVFYRRLEEIMLHYFSQYAIEFDEGEAESLFAFLISQSILPIQTMEYILGFGGPIADAITKSLLTLREHGFISQSNHGEVIYLLGQIWGGHYFFKGHIQKHRWSNNLEGSPIETLLSSESVVLVEQLLKEQGFDDASDQVSASQWQLYQLVLLLGQEKVTPLIVGINLGGDFLQAQIFEYLLQKELQNNQLIQLSSYKYGEKYDCLLTSVDVDSDIHQPLYRIKNQFSYQEIKDVVNYLQEQLRLKKTESIAINADFMTR